MKYERAEIFSSGTEYEIFKYNYCENGCIHHVEREEDGFPALLEDGGCPIEDGMECARFNAELFPNVLLRVVDGDKYVKWHHCPFYRKAVQNEIDRCRCNKPEELSTVNNRYAKVDRRTANSL